MKQQTVTINGTVYDKVTGMPIRHSGTSTGRSQSYASAIHQTTQKSTTLQRKYVTAPAAKIKPTPTAAAAPAVEHQRSSMINKYAKPAAAPATATTANRPVQSQATPKPNMQPRTGRTTRVINDFGPVTHPIVAKQTQTLESNKRPAATMPKPSDIIKAEATQKALEEAPSHNRRQRPKRQKKPKNRFANFMSLASAGTALLLIAGYFTYVNMPNLSVRVAAAQAGVEATYPGYHPSGYSLSGKIAFDDGQVSMRFASNGTDQAYTLKQSNSAWDSTAVLENYVQPLAGEDYTTSTESGLTVYTFDGSNAAWVNDGILYTIEGDAPLSTDQIRQIAVSL